jgi:hypothetical protein
MNYGLIFWGTLPTIVKSLGCKRRYSELLWDIGIEILVVMYLRN